MGFFGRKAELSKLHKLQAKKTASLVCVLGRRRIGKSSLIEKFGASFKYFVEIQGLGPDNNPSNQDQLDHFAAKLSIIFKSKKEKFQDWTEALHSLAQKTHKGEYLILLDEISWMGKQDPLFASKIKEAWDIAFKKNPKLILVLCGSVSTWIEENILKNADFEGRISLELNVQELSIPEINQFWVKKKYHMGALEKMLILSVTGGVPKYIEEVLSGETAEQNIVRLCFSPSGFLFKEYERIFKDIFQRRTKTLESIVRLCLTEKLSPVALAKKLHVEQSGELSEYINALEISGFLRRDYYFKPDGNPSKLSHLRVKDNYLRFYLKYIEPMKIKIERGGKTIQSLYDLKSFDSIMGFQFENLILANQKQLHSLLEIPARQVISSAPFVQKKNSTTRGGCQIDLLIHTEMDVFYLCEFKCQKTIDRSIIRQVEKKVALIKLPKRSSVKPILVYAGNLYPDHEREIRSYFYKIITFEDFFNSPANIEI